MHRLLAPAALLLGRLPLALKFLVVGLILAVPLGVVVYAYVDAEHSHVSFSAKERIGVKAMAPLLRLTSDVAVVRSEAVDTGRAVAVPASDIEAAATEQRRYGAALSSAAEWRSVNQLLSLAAREQGAQALAAYDRAATALLRLIVHVGDGSNLTLDPDLDSYYVMDAIQFRIPALIDATGRIADKWTLASKRGGRASEALLNDTGIALGAIQSAATALDNSINTASIHTADSAVGKTLPVLRSDVEAAIKALDARLTALPVSGARGALRKEASVALAAIDRLAGVAVAQLDRLLVARISHSEARSDRIELLAALAALLALYLFAGFYLCITVPVRRIVGTLRAVASGDHTRQVTVASRDEFGFVARVLNDMVDKVRQATEKLAHDATHDILTGLPNRAFVIGQLERLLPRASRQRSLSVLFIDLDGFKPVNDSIGHSAGDEVLRTISARLGAAARPTDLLARLAGDEFLVVCADLPRVEAAIALANRMLEAIAPEIAVHDPTGDAHLVAVGASIGVTFVTDTGTEAEQVLRNADVAMYRAKQRGRGRVEVFGDSLRQAVEERQLMREELRRGISHGELEVYYQPIVELGGRQTIGFEALVRWHHPERGLLSPAAFMPIAEESWLINALGAEVLKTACRQLAAWTEDPALPDRLHMSVNLSARQLTDPELVTVVAGALSDAGIDARTLCLEITETALLADPVAAAEALSALHKMGVRLALDDFGTGYSSLQHLKDFPLDMIKLDRTFVSGLGPVRRPAGHPSRVASAADGPLRDGRGMWSDNEHDEAIVQAVIGLAEAFRLSVVAEGVETEEQLERLVQLRCVLAQGYLFGAPAPPEKWGRSAAAAGAAGGAAADGSAGAPAADRWAGGRAAGGGATAPLAARPLPPPAVA